MSRCCRSSICCEFSPLSRLVEFNSSTTCGSGIANKTCIFLSGIHQRYATLNSPNWQITVSEYSRLPMSLRTLIHRCRSPRARVPKWPLQGGHANPKIKRPASLLPEALLSASLWRLRKRQLRNVWRSVEATSAGIPMQACLAASAVSETSQRSALRWSSTILAGSHEWTNAPRVDPRPYATWPGDACRYLYPQPHLPHS
jgi:hypothetical protein